MRIATYNIAFGLNARSLIKSALGHLSIHLLRSPWLVEKQSLFLKPALDLACSVSADLLCLNETLPYFHESEIESRLSRADYTIIREHQVSSGHALRIDTVLATKQKAQRLNFNLPHAPLGRNVAAYIPSANLTAVAVHLNVFSKVRRQQIVAIENFVADQRDKKRKVILMGDFNCGLKDLGVLGLDGCSLPTYLYPAYMRLVSNFARDLDHIMFSPDFSIKQSKTLKGYSDHLLLCCDLAERG